MTINQINPGRRRDALRCSGRSATERPATHGSRGIRRELQEVTMLVLLTREDANRPWYIVAFDEDPQRTSNVEAARREHLAGGTFADHLYTLAVNADRVAATISRGGRATGGSPAYRGNAIRARTVDIGVAVQPRRRRRTYADGSRKENRSYSSTSATDRSESDTKVTIPITSQQTGLPLERIQ